MNEVQNDYLKPIFQFEDNIQIYCLKYHTFKFNYSINPICLNLLIKKSAYLINPKSVK